MGDGPLQKTFSHFRNKMAYLLNAGFAKPQLIYLKITSLCNFHCQNCDIWQGNSRQDLPLLEWEKIILKIKKHNRDSSIILSGGEPLLYKDFWPLADFLRRENIAATLNTNGALINEKNIERLLRAPFQKISVSLYSLNKEVHNSLRNTGNAFEKSFSALLSLAKKREQLAAKTELIVACLLNSKNISDLPAFIDFFSKHDIAVSLQALDTNIQAMSGRLDFEQKALISQSPLWPNNKKLVSDIFEKILAMKTAGSKIYNRADSLKVMRDYYLDDFAKIKKRPCYVGQNNLIITAEGDAFFCFSGPPIGNLTNNTWLDVWNGREARQIRKRVKHCPALCRVMNCNFQSNLWQMASEKIKKMF